MSDIAAVILAGGRAERLGGVNKVLVEIGGRRLIDRVLDALTECDPILLAAGTTHFPEDIAVPMERRIADLSPCRPDPFANVNTPEDLAALRARASS